MSGRGGELVTTDEPTVISKPFLDAIVVEDSESNGRFSDSSWADESEWGEALCGTDDLLDQLATPETGPWRRGRRFSKRNVMQKQDAGFPGI